MRHRCTKARFGLPVSHAIAKLRNLSASLLEHGRIETTLKNAKVLRPFVEKIITKGRLCAAAPTYSSADARFRDIRERLGNNQRAAELVARVWGPYFHERAGGYTRILRTRWRVGDGAEMAIIELVLGEDVDVEMLKDHIQQLQTDLFALAVPEVHTLAQWRLASQAIHATGARRSASHSDGCSFELDVKFREVFRDYWPMKRPVKPGDEPTPVPMPLTVRVVFPGLKEKDSPVVAFSVRRIDQAGEVPIHLLKYAESPTARFLYHPSPDLYRLTGQIKHEDFKAKRITPIISIDGPVGEIFHAPV